MPAPTPTLTPIAFDAGQDWKLVEANGRDETSLTQFYGRITIKQRVVDSGETPIVSFWRLEWGWVRAAAPGSTRSAHRILLPRTSRPKTR